MTTMQLELTTQAPAFVWDNDYKNTEQVRPYLAAFTVLHDEFEKNHGTAYNALFKGRIPGLAGSVKEDTGIYLLQQLADLEQTKEKIANALARGGYHLSERTPRPNETGTLIRFGWYVGGTGYSELPNVRTVKIDESGSVLFKLPKQRNWRTYHLPASLHIFIPVTS